MFGSQDGRWREIQRYAAAKSLQSCPTLCNPIDGSLSDSPVPGILQARTLEWVAISFSNAWKWKVNVNSLSHVQLFVTPWTAAYQVPLSMEFSRQRCWSRLPFSTPRYLPDSGVEPTSLCLLHWQPDSSPLCLLGSHKVSLHNLKTKYWKYKTGKVHWVFSQPDIKNIFLIECPFYYYRDKA